MRIHLKTTASYEMVPFNYQPLLTGAIHKWIGRNEIHDGLSLYSFSWLHGGEPDGNGLKFKNGAQFFISAHDVTLLKKIIDGIKKEPEIAYGLKVMEIIMQEGSKFAHRCLTLRQQLPILS
ncbi:MAG: hypothetical protein U5L09_22910 [Bacteroidales bacterium]|nr:hypothetical protein [Bacteroidales bacterium]